ncbi:hypothetical protein DSM112329_02639 [Paraconexibacter sp. AEG42_29]|uniref:PASTA domain-containing protein n=1 Tax=Paraconexibacter sp. AEG42_29 TaxID=2997339 RepID=A0AAU7AVZ2_9ACTN
MHDEHTHIDPAGPAGQWRPSRLTVALAGAGGFLAGVLLVAALGGTPTTTVSETTTQAVTVTAPAQTLTTPPSDPGPSFPTVPELVGARLDQAQDRLDDLQLRASVLGGGTFGVVDETNWVVVQQDPPSGTRLATGADVVLRIERG